MNIGWKIVNIGDVPVYVVWRNNENVDIVYAPFHQRVMSLRPFLRTLSESTIEERLVNFPELKKPIFTLYQIHATQDQSLSTVHLSIGLSNNCTLECTYCHANAGLGKKVINFDLLMHAIDATYKKASEKGNEEILVSFSAGGEPTFNWKEFTNSISYIKSKEQETGIKTKIQMTTNGYYGDKKRNFIINNLSQVTLSLDGIKDIQNKQRPAVNNMDSFEHVVETAKYFYQKQFPFGIRSTVTRQGSNYLCEFVRFVVKEIGKVPMAFEPIAPIGRASQHIKIEKNDEFAVDLVAFSESFWSAYLLGEELGIPISTSSINLKKLVPRMCGAMALPSLTVTSNGKITACHRDNEGVYSYGAINPMGELLLNADKIAEIKQLSNAPPSCDDCFCRYSCAGDCPDMHKNGLNRCTHTRYLTFRALEHKAKMFTNHKLGG